MLRQKPLFISLVLAGLVAAQDVHALGLGRLNVATGLGQPLVAEVDLSATSGDDLDSIRANIASPAAYKNANVEYQGVLQNIRVQVLRRASGQPYLRLRVRKGEYGRHKSVAAVATAARFAAYNLRPPVGLHNRSKNG